MNAAWLHQPWIETLGWTLLHSLWELSLIAAVAAAVLICLRRRSAQARYAASYTLLLAMMLAPVGTYGYLWRHMPEPSSAAVSIPSAHPAASGPPVIVQIIQGVPARGAGHASLAASTLERLQFLAPYAALLYLLGATLLTLRLLLGHQLLRRIRGNALPATPHEALLAQLRQRLHISTHVWLRQSDRVEVPTVIGAFRPMILLPLSAMTGLSTEHLTYLLLHELAHIRRHDYLANLLQSLIDTLLFYHPAVHWLSAIIRQEREHCCDDLALAAAGDRRGYAEALASMESLRTSPPLALGARGGSLLHRIARILDIPMPRSVRSRTLAIFPTLAVAAALALSLYLLGCAHGASQRDAARTTPSITASSRQPLKTQTFDLRNLLLQPSDTVPPAVITHGEPRNTSPATDTKQEIGDRIVRTIKETIDPRSWDGTNDQSPSIKLAGATLIVRQTPANLSAIEQLLHRLDARTTISVDTRIMFVDEAQFRTLASRYPHLLDSLMHPDGKVAADLLTAKQVTDLLAEITSNKRTISVASPRITLFDGQQGFIQMLNEQGFISGAHAAAGATQPVLDGSILTKGIVLSVEAAASPDQKSVAMELSLELRQLVRFDQKPVENYPGSEHIAIQTPVMDVHKVMSLLSIPDGSIALIGGPMIAKGLETPASPPVPPHEPWHVMLLVRPHIIGGKNMEKTIYDSRKPLPDEKPAWGR